MPSKTLANDMIGHRFGRIIVLSEATEGRWHGKCDCGTTKLFLGKTLRNGNTKSCGCLQSESRKTASITHGETSNSARSAEFRAWIKMRERCLDNGGVDFANYGGRGIKVCAAWARSFANFLRDMGRKPTKKHSLDRIDVNGDYAPENCRWATQAQQTRNTRRNRYVVFNGERMTVADAAQRSGVPLQTALYRLNNGYSVAESFTPSDLRRH